MKNRVRRLLTVALGVAIATLAPGCWTPWGGTYDLDVLSAENTESQLQSLYLIVAPKAEVQEFLSAQHGELLDDDRIQRYTSFAQYEPVAGGTWKLVHQGRRSDFVTAEIDENTIEVEVDHELIEKSSMSELCLVVLAFFGNDGFQQVTVEHAMLDAEASQVVEVGPGTLDLRAQ
jgi:hypothetical protein